jgi:hypothetical protein
MSIFADIVRWREAGEIGLVQFPMPLIKKMVSRLAGPGFGKMGFTLAGPAFWVRRKKEPIREVIDMWGRGIGLNLRGGVVLPFVPSIQGTRVLRLSAPEKTGVPLWLPGFDREDFPEMFSQIYPRPGLLAEAISARVPVWQEIFRESFGAYRGLPGLRDCLVEVRRESPERNRKNVWFAEQYLALAFVHARLGERRKAEAVLESTIKHLKNVRPHAVKLRKMLAENFPT